MTSLQLVIDCADPHALAGWWAETLGWTVEPSDEDFIRRMVAEGRATDDDTRTFRGRLVWATGQAINQPDAPAGSACPRILFQLVPESKTVKNRAHLDVHLTPVAELDAARDALVARGATFLYEATQGPFHWYTLADPEGNEFCVN